MEKLEMRAYISSPDTGFPDKILTTLASSASLKYLALDGFGVYWGHVQLLKGLETFHISSIPERHRPLAVQVLYFLSQMPTLKHFSVDRIHPLWGASPSHDLTSGEQTLKIELKSLEHIKVACENPSILASFFNSLTFTNGAVEYISSIDLTGTPTTFAHISAYLRTLAQSMDNAYEGLITKAFLKECSVQFWKSEDDLHSRPVVQVPVTVSFSESGSQQSEHTLPQTAAVRVEELPRGRIDFNSFGTSVRVYEYTFMFNVLPGLRLNYLVSLEVDLYGLHMEVWKMLGDLPSLAHLTLHHYYTDNLFKIMELGCPRISDDTAEQSEAVPIAWANTDLHTVLGIAGPTFPALTTLVFRNWRGFYRLEIRETLVNVVKLRARANMPIKALRFEICADLVEVKDRFLSDLQHIVDQVIVV
ncbi:hypothetical protein H0H92_007994 [Tricholoma furcatifolium]|nr:hypothetical protein H0H92_007994 [Tricholoma furcatifolium]